MRAFIFLLPAFLSVAAHAGDLVGEYKCRIGEYAAFKCVLSKKPDGTLWLEKLTGSQRFKGTVTPQDKGFAFDGDYFCPYGSCDGKMTATFAPEGKGFKGAAHVAGVQETVVLERVKK